MTEVSTQFPVFAVPSFDRFAVAARLRGLMAGQDGGVTGLTANRLGVSELALRMSIDDGDPHPTMEIIIAVVQQYGVDPTWLVTGAYDPDTHRRAMENDMSIANLLSGKLDRQPPPSSSDSRQSPS